MTARAAVIVAVAMCFGLAARSTLHAAGAKAANPQNLASYDWSVLKSPNLAKNPPPQKVVEDFISSFEDREDAALDKEAGVYVCSFQFADLRRDGFLSLVFGVGIKDRPSCRGVTIIDRTKSGFESYGAGGEIDSGSDISEQIRDLHHDGHLEFLLDYGGAEFPQRCAANWTAIYAWTGSNYTNVSSDFKDFYRQRLDSLKKVIPALTPIRNQMGYRDSDKECLEAEAAAIERFLGSSPDAGLDQAMRLAQSEDRLAREFGTVLLINIGGSKAREQLEKLTRDPDYGVWAAAKNGLSMPLKFRFAPASFVRSDN
jgi:hypothetical protein